MICFSTQFLSLIGIRDAKPAEFIAPDVWVSAVFSFGARGTRPAVDQFATQPHPRSLTLVGMGDRYGEAAGIGATVTELCVVTPDTPRAPTPDEARTIIALLEEGLVVGPIMPIIDALRAVAEGRPTTEQTTTDLK